MSRLYRHVKEMMRGRRPNDLFNHGADDEETDDEGDSQHQSEGESVNELTNGIDKLKFALDVDGDMDMV